MRAHPALARLALVGATALLALTGCERAPPPDHATLDRSNQTLAGLIGDDPELSRLSHILVETGIGAALDGQGVYTVLAPTDDAFARLDPTFVERAETRAVLVAVLRGHMLPGTVTPDGLRRAIARDGEVRMRTLDGRAVTFSARGAVIRVEDAAGHGATLGGGTMVGANGAVLPVDGFLGSLPAGVRDGPAAPADAQDAPPAAPQ